VHGCLPVPSENSSVPYLVSHHFVTVQCPRSDAYLTMDALIVSVIFLLTYLCILLKPLDKMRCHLPGTVMRAINIVLDRGTYPLTEREDLGVTHSLSALHVYFTQLQFCGKKIVCSY